MYTNCTGVGAREFLRSSHGVTLIAAGERDIAIRGALGASSRGIFVHLLTENIPWSPSAAGSASPGVMRCCGVPKGMRSLLSECCHWIQLHRAPRGDCAGDGSNDRE